MSSNSTYIKPVHNILNQVLFNPEIPHSDNELDTHIWLYNKISRVAVDNDERLLAKNAVSDMWYLGAPAVDLAKKTYEDDREARDLVYRSIPQLTIIATMGDENWQKLKNLPRWVPESENVLHHSQRRISPDRLRVTSNPRTEEEVIYYDDEARKDIQKAMEQSEYYETAEYRSGCPAHGAMLNSALKRYVDVVFFPSFIDPQTAAQ